MPESPVSGQFSSVPAGKKALTAEEMQNMVASKVEQAAKVLGGTVTESPVKDQDPLKAEPSLVPIDEEDKKKYLRSLLAKEPFTKIYNLFGGKLRVVFRTRKSQEAEALVQLDVPARERHKERMKYSLLGMELGDNLSNRKPAGLDDLDDVASSAVHKSFNDFEELCEELFRRANDTDFWTRTAGRT